MNNNNIPIIIDLSKNITIYGAYFPKRLKIRLENLRDCLIKKGWYNVKLVSDYRNNYFPFELTLDEDTNNLYRSRYCIRNSDLNILVYMFNGPLTGIQFELDLIVHEKLTNFLLFVEYKEIQEKEILVWSSLITARLKEIGKSFIKFPENDNNYLCKTANQRIVDYFL